MKSDKVLSDHYLHFKYNNGKYLLAICILFTIGLLIQMFMSGVVLEVLGRIVELVAILFFFIYNRWFKRSKAGHLRHLTGGGGGI